MSHSFCPGYAAEPFASLVADFPGEEMYPAKDFRIEWGPIFHRGRLDGSARVLVLGQDPATHETITRRILVGEAGQRVQGLLHKIGITRSYVMVNAFVYSVYGQGGGNRHAKNPLIASYRSRWLDSLLLETQVTSVVTMGHLAATAYADWAEGQPGRAEELHLAQLRHPTYPESASRSSGKPLVETTALLLANWNSALPELSAHVQPDGEPSEQGPLFYKGHWQDGDLQPIPEGDLPPGSPPWWLSMETWAQRFGADKDTKRATIAVTVPEEARSWLVYSADPRTPWQHQPRC